MSDASRLDESRSRRVQISKKMINKKYTLNNNLKNKTWFSNFFLITSTTIVDKDIMIMNTDI